MDTCVCIDQNEWNEADMACQSKKFDVLLTAIVGTGVICNYVINLALGGLGNVMFLIIKKKLSMVSQMSQVNPEPSSMLA